MYPTQNNCQYNATVNAKNVKGLILSPTFRKHTPSTYIVTHERSKFVYAIAEHR